MENTLYFGDNLSVLNGHDGQGRPYFPDACVDLIYLDPPFNSNRFYNVLFKDEHGGHGGEFAAGYDITTLKHAQRAASTDDAQPARIGGCEPDE